MQALDAAHEYRFVMPIAQFGAAVMPMLTFTGYKKDESFFSLLLQETRRQAVLYPNFLRPMPRLSEPLSPAEMQVLRLLCGNRSNQEIADILGVKVATVKTHVIHILQKLGVKRRGDAKEIAQKTSYHRVLTKTPDRSSREFFLFKYLISAYFSKNPFSAA